MGKVWTHAATSAIRRCSAQQGGWVWENISDETAKKQIAKSLLLFFCLQFAMKKMRLPYSAFTFNTFIESLHHIFKFFVLVDLNWNMISLYNNKS